MSYLNSVTLVGFVGSDPEQRPAKGNGSKFTVFSLATQRSWKNADDEWTSKTEWHRIVLFRPRLADHVARTIKKGAHVLVEGFSSARSTSRTAKARSRKPRRLPRGRSAPIPCASSTATSKSVRRPPAGRRRNLTRLPL